MFAESTLRAFQPALALHRISGRARVNMIQLKELLKVYVRGDTCGMRVRPGCSVRASFTWAAALVRMGEALLQILTAPPVETAQPPS